jgi:diacylglycerol kinase family enzyme
MVGQETAHGAAHGAAHESVPVVVNRRAGAVATHGRLRLTAAARSLDWLEALEQRPGQQLWLLEPADMQARVEALLSAGSPRVAIGGGDGTIASLAPLFLHRRSECVCLPLGTQNHFAKDLGIDLRPTTWDALLRSRRVLEVDVGQVNGRVFLNNVSVGLYPRMIRQRSRLEGGRLLGSKRLASLWATFQVLRHRLHKRFTVEWQTDSGSGRFTTRALHVANDALGRRPYAPRSPAALSRRELALFAPQALGVLDLARMASYALTGNIAECPGLDVITARSIRLELHARRVSAGVDGELVHLHPPINVNHHAQRLRAVVPEEPV